MYACFFSSRTSSVKVSRRRICLFPSFHQTANQVTIQVIALRLMAALRDIRVCHASFDVFGQGAVTAFPKNMGDR